MSEPCDLTAVEARRLIGTKQLSATELLESCIARIEAIDPAVNAMVARDFDRARATAKAADAAVARGDALPPLHGLPIGIKDLEPTAGLRTTFGSPLFRDNVPAKDQRLVARSARPGRSSSARPTRRSSAPEPTPATPSTARPAIRSIRQNPAPDRPADRRSRWRQGWCRSARAPTPADRCETPRRSAASSGSARPRAWCRPSGGCMGGAGCPSSVRWGAPSPTPRCCSAA